MKKILSLILAVVLIVTSFTAVSAIAPVTTDDIAISTNVFDITVTVETTEKATMTAMLTNKYTNIASASLHGILSNRTPSSILDETGAVIGYKYTFNFSMLEEDVTGKYVVNIGFKGVSVQKEFAYACLDDKVSFYDTLNSKAADEIKDYFVTNPLLVPVDLTVYNSLTGIYSDVLTKVNAQIDALNLVTGVTNTDTTEQKIQKLDPVDTLFTTRFAELMTVATIVTSTETTWPGIAGRLMGDSTFDNYYYDPEKVDTAVIAAADVYDKFQTEAAGMTDYTIAEVSAAFDKATLTFIEELRSVGILKDAFERFVLADNNTIAISATGKENIKKLVSAEKDADLWRDLRLADNTDCATLIANAESIAQTMIDNGILNDTEGGTTDGVTGGTVIDRPTGNGGGGSLGGGSGTSKPEEPETPEVPAGTFTDINNVEWAKESIEALAKMGVLNGKGDGKFAPNDSVTREEFVKIIVAAFELSDGDAECDFADVSADSWSYPYIAAAAKLGIVSGDGDNFNPRSGISRQDMAVIIFRVFEHLGAEVSGDSIAFDDSADIAGYAKEAVDALTASGIINGMGDGTFAPSGTVTRAQAAKVVYGLLDLVGGGK